MELSALRQRLENGAGAAHCSVDDAELPQTARPTQRQSSLGICETSALMVSFLTTCWSGPSPL